MFFSMKFITLKQKICLMFFSIRQASPLKLANPNQLKLASLILNFTMQSVAKMGSSSGARLINEHLHNKTSSPH
ncbi:hypothetical protein BDA96_08G051100 [Sorghum bicolor]|uniref:Uncharacterized protein n=2 Tax=Sorghum bicolor TaxID=4558 RepID=A0A921QEF4_SORBI|nr:hypothetical protein BDA96_09G022600 [Sorghum bicolor]KAG0520178.1 hypothetical protein BDA96_08G051100 [Sorghum bicolor]KXG21149.1 hypothetical protein SORBI_3009G021800 [Sorghum bicolor]